MKNSALWEKLTAYAFDAETGSQPFSVKLAEAEGWDATFAVRVIEEYRRFLYMTQVSEGEVTPSVAVDQAWHCHLTFTRAYWEGLCDGVLGAPLHHDPCKGSEDMPRYNAQYKETIALYVAEFGHRPPDDIWPVAAGDLSAPSKPSLLRKWLCTWGIGGGLIGSMGALVLLVIFGVNFWTITLLAICGGLIAAGVFAFPGGKGQGHPGGGMVVGGCGTSKGDGGSAGCGGGGCGGGGG